MPVEPEDLIDASEVAAIIGLRRAGSVSEYRKRYSNFPAPVVEKPSGKATLWLRADIEAWVAGR